MKQKKGEAFNLYNIISTVEAWRWQHLVVGVFCIMKNEGYLKILRQRHKISARKLKLVLLAGQ